MHELLFSVIKTIVQLKSMHLIKKNSTLRLFYRRIHEFPNYRLHKIAPQAWSIIKVKTSTIKMTS